MTTQLHIFGEPCQLTHDNKCSRIIHRDEGLQCFRKFILTASSETFHFNTQLLPFIRFVTGFNALIILSLSISCSISREKRPAHWPSPKTSELAACSASSMVGGHPSREFFHWEQLTIPTNVCERDGSSSFCLSSHVPDELRALQHDIFHKDVARLHILKHLVPCVPIPFLVHCGTSSCLTAHFRHAIEFMDTHIGDPLADRNRFVVNITEKVLVRLLPGLPCPALLLKPPTLPFLR